MVTTTRRTRQRQELERDIMSAARRLLAEEGRQAVGLRAIARELGVTAPALYRYFDSKDTLLRALCEDVDGELARALTDAAQRIPQHDLGERPVAASWAFRRWALEHPREFELLFSFQNADFRLPLDAPSLDLLQQDRYIMIFFQTVIEAMAAGVYTSPGDDIVPGPLVAEIRASHREFVDALTAMGVADAERFYGIGAEYLLTKSWVQIFGHVALEVHSPHCFGRIDPAKLFGCLMDEALEQMGYRRHVA